MTFMQENKIKGIPNLTWTSCYLELPTVSLRKLTVIKTHSNFQTLTLFHFTLGTHFKIYLQGSVSNIRFKIELLGNPFFGLCGGLLLDVKFLGGTKKRFHLFVLFFVSIVAHPEISIFYLNFDLFYDLNIDINYMK